MTNQSFRPADHATGIHTVRLAVTENALGGTDSLKQVEPHGFPTVELEFSHDERLLPKEA